jgi:3'-phosphoadenosine 5'-phosphosulfate sulfotransferase (PAPS reductase)/FAD synthetase
MPPSALGRPYDDSRDQPLPGLPEPPAAPPAGDMAARMAAADVAKLTRTQRERRLDSLIEQAYATYERAIREQVTMHLDGKGRTRRLAATFLLFSGGNDSTVLAHLFRHRATHAVHANTGIGIEATRQFVRDTCASWDLPLIEKTPPPGSRYEDLVVAQGFPGPAQHYKMYQRLKERALEAALREVIGNPWRNRVIYLAGRRADESARRANIPDIERRKSVVWVSPLRDWTKLDLNTYRLRHPDIPHNAVTDLIHMSGECLDGAFAHPGELDEVTMWYPEFKVEIDRLTALVKAAGHTGARTVWGWGAYPALRGRQKRSKSGALCGSCDARGEMERGAAGEPAPEASAPPYRQGNTMRPTQLELFGATA